MLQCRILTGCSDSCCSKTGKHRAAPWLCYPPTLIWNECEIILVFRPAVLWRGPVWCFIYRHPCAQNSVNPLFVFKHLSCLLCVSLSPRWLLWTVCLAGCRWSWSGRWPAVGIEVWFQGCLIEDLIWIVCLAFCLSEYLTVCHRAGLLFVSESSGVWVTKDLLEIIKKKLDFNLKLLLKSFSLKT